jgi:multiple sugar transport system ATP-binding protein
MSKIELRQVNKRYPGAQVLTINKADLTIDDGEFCVFVGPSGCGKSTLLRMVAGLEEITSGDLLIGGERVNNVPPAKRGVAMVFQSYALYPHMTVRENMAFGLQTFGADKAAIDAKVREAAELLQLTHLLERLPKQLSGGQRQRVAIGRAIVKEPRVFLFDEPLSNLDAALRVQTRLEIARLHKRIGNTSMIYVTHDQVEAMTLADKIVLLHAGDRIQTHGSVAQVGTPLQLYHRPASMFVGEFIGSPKMNALPGTLQQASPLQANVQVGSSSVAVSVNAHHLAGGSAVHVGVRPEDIRIVSDGAGVNRLVGGVSHVERLGDCSMLYIDLGQGLPMLTVSVDGTAALRAGDRVTLQLAPDTLHLFDADGMACHRTVELPN